MRIRSHITRPLDPANPWNRAILILSSIAGAIGALLTVVSDRQLFLSVVAGGTTFLCWALVRELDPDHQAPAIVAAVAGGIWALIGMPTAVLPILGLMLVARLLVETTGRRPLFTDLAAMAIVAAAISFTPVGWVVGFGLAIAVYVDDRMAEDHNRQALLAGMAAAVASTAVVSLSGSIAEAIPAARPLLAALTGLLALIAVGREPVDPVSFVDSRNKRFLRRDRLHAGRAAAGLLIFGGAVVSGQDAAEVVPMTLALAIALVSSEWERWRRSRPPRLKGDGDTL